MLQVYLELVKRYLVLQQLAEVERTTPSTYG